MKSLYFIVAIFFAGSTFAQEDNSDRSAIAQVVDTIIEQDQKTPHKYRMNYWFSAGLSVVATAANIYAIPNIIKAKPQLTDEEINSLNTKVFNGFDRWALEQDPSKRDINYRNSDYLLPAIIVSTGLLGFDKEIRKDWLRIFMMYYETHAITFSLYNFSFFGPAFQNKLRPVVYYDYFTYDERRGGNNRNSLYSGHTATATAATFFAAKVFADYHPELGRKKYLLYGLASVPPLIEGYLRMKALAHFPTDIMVGFMIGATVGVVVPELHKFKDRKFHLGLTATPVGPGVCLNWIPEPKKQMIFKF
ncbi:MAG TPA: phosphatase PAP2 family protein [Flavipsychrobacter sp.]|nr:phosphatase PAP2 family protein [Flavipsychrobacter sp.]